MYRPDVFVGHTLLRDLVVFPGNLLWNAPSLPRATAVVLLVVSAIGSLLLAAGGWRLKALDVV
jgi:hypothetical protein